MFEVVRSVVGIAVPVYVVSTMLNVGLTQTLAAILGHLREWPFVTKMLIANFVLVPLVMIVVVRVVRFDPAVEAGLLVFSLCAGAPFLIKLTQAAQHDLVLGAAIMMLLVVVTVVYVPVVLPIVVEGVTVDAWAIARSLLLQLMVPIAVGMLAMRFLPSVAKPAQPWIARLGNYTLYVVIAATLIGYFPDMLDIVGTGAILVALGFIAAAFGIGYQMGGGKDHHEDVGDWEPRSATPPPA